MNGHEVLSAAAHVRRSIGFAGQYPAVEAAMTGRENVRMLARLYGLGARSAATKADELLDRLGSPARRISSRAHTRAACGASSTSP